MVPPTRCPRPFGDDSRRGNYEAGQPEKWLERCLRVPGAKWGGAQLSG